ncbi:MAG TPA: hypothetical protein VFT22_03255, partial [Kofleriaceae bacterium]|nr:hypothetical protein [Kofleriaceae bacterium]
PDDRYPSMEALLRDFEAALPPGADRLLIEAQSGTTLQATPFAGALGRRDSQRMRAPSNPTPQSSHSSVITLPRAAPRKVRLPVVLGAVLVGSLAGVLAWRQLVVAPSAAARAGDRGAPSKSLAAPSPVASGPTADPTTSSPAPPSAPVTSSAAAPAAPPAEPAEPAEDHAEPGDDSAAIAMAIASAPAKAGHPAAVKRPLVRAKPVVRRDPLRPGKRVASMAAVAPGAPVASGTAAASEPAPAPEAGSATHADAPAERDALAVLPSPGALPIAAPLPPPPPPPPGPGALDATPSVVTLDVKGSLSPAIVRRSIERTLGSLRACYRTAARAAGSTPAVDLRISFEIDENSLATRVAASGTNLGSLASCAASVTGQIRTPEAPDVGTSQVTVVIRFRPS